MSTTQVSDQAFVSTREAADRLGVSVRTIQLWVESGILHAWKTAGGHRRIARASVDSLLAQQQAVIETVSGLQVRKVVLIDDNPTQRKLYKLKLESLDFPVLVTAADSPFRGLMAIGAANPDFVIVSLDMTGIDIADLLTSIAEHLPTAGIIALTASRRNLPPGIVDNIPPKATLLEAIGELDSIGPLLRNRRPR